MTSLLGLLRVVVAAVVGSVGQLRPDPLPVIGAEIPARDLPICRFFDICTAVEWHTALPPVVHSVRSNIQLLSKRTESACDFYGLVDSVHTQMVHALCIAVKHYVGSDKQAV